MMDDALGDFCIGAGDIVDEGCYYDEKQIIIYTIISHIYLRFFLSTMSFNHGSQLHPS